MQTQTALPTIGIVPTRRVEQDLAELEKRANAIHLSMHAVAKAAGVRSSQLSQWKTGDGVTGTTFRKHLERMGRVLAAEERALRAYLNRRARSR